MRWPPVPRILPQARILPANLEPLSEIASFDVNGVREVSEVPGRAAEQAGIHATGKIAAPG